MSQLFFCKANLLTCFSEFKQHCSKAERNLKCNLASQFWKHASFSVDLIGVVAVCIGSAHVMVYKNILMFVSEF